MLVLDMPANSITYKVNIGWVVTEATMSEIQRQAAKFNHKYYIIMALWNN